MAATDTAVPPSCACASTQAVSASTTLGQLVDSSQRAVFVFYDEWTTSGGGHAVGGKVRECPVPPPSSRGGITWEQARSALSPD